MLPPGADIPDGALIGIKSKPPANDEMSPGDTWFGSPPIKLPVRQKFDAGGANWTYEAPRWKKFARAAFEAVHISLPTMLYITFGTWAIEWFGPAVLEGAYLQVLWMFIASSAIIAMAMTAVVIMREMGDDGPLRAGHEADVVVVGDAHRSDGRAVLGPRRQGHARAFALHAVPALGPCACSARNSARAACWT